jgi:hypothetical protein
LVLAVVLVRSADGEHGLLRALLEFAVLTTSLQIGYVVGLVSHSIPSVSERRGTTAAPPATRPVRGLFVFHPHPSSRVAPRAAAARQHSARIFQMRYSEGGRAAMIHSSHRDRKAKAIAEVLAMIDADLPLAPHRPRPVLETEEWLFESATEFIEALEKYYAERTTQIKRKNH